MNNMNYFDITVTRGSGGFGLSLIYRGLDKFPAPETGIFVARVVPGGHSHRAGLQENDKVLKINKREPRDVNDAVAIIKKAGKTLVISVGRKQPDILNNQGEPHLVPTIHIQKPLSRSGSARSLNTSIIQGQSPVRSHTPFNSDVNQQQRFLQQQQQQQQQQYAQQQYEQQLAQQQYEDQQRQQQEQLQRQQQEQLLRQQQEQLQRQQQEQLDREQLERERAAIAAENRRIHAQQLELQRQKEELRKAQELQNQQIPDKSRYGTAAGSTGQLVSDILSGAGLPRGDLSRARSLSRAAVYTTDSSDEEEEAAGNKFIRNRRSKSVDGRRNRAKSPGSLSGISFHDLSELSTVSKMSRFEEKDHMQGLNNRLAGYIDKVRQLQTENTRMTKQVEYIEESQMKELGSIKHLYDKEVNDLKNAIDSLARSYRELQGNSDKVLQTNRELKTKVNRKASDVKANNDRILGLKEELAKIRSRVNAAEKDKGKVAAKLNDVLPEVDRVQEKISETLYQLGNIRKVNKDLEEQTGKLSLELKDKMARMDTTLEEVKVRKQMEVIEISGKLEKEYESRVQNALASLREVYENQVKEGRDEFNRKYEERVEELQSKLSKERFNNSSTGQNVEETNRRVSALISKVSNLEDERTRLSDKLNQLERRLRDQQANQNIQMKGKDDEIRKLMAEINKNMEDYQNLLHVKTALDMEIAVYRKLVESEEDRLGIDVTETGSQSLPSSRGCSSPSSPITRTTLFKSQQDNYSRKVTHNQTQL